jgi:hypothetical protein
MIAVILAIACGVCVEDKVAATYDHALVERALAQHRVVVFAEPRASVDERRLKAFAAAARRAPGVEAATVKTSAAPASVSFVLDPKRADAKKTVASLQLDLLKVLGDRPLIRGQTSASGLPPKSVP